MHTSVVDRVWQLADPVAIAEGLEVVDVEYRREGRAMVLRVFLDHANGDGRVSLDELTRVSRQLGDLLDVHEAVAGSYTLEVSSPGINRRLRRPEHFRRVVGGKVRIRAHTPIGGRRSFVGTLAEVRPDGVAVVDTAGATHVIGFADIGQANYEPEE